MKNKAFTLVELLGVIVLLGILGIVIIPKVGDSITNSKETAYITQEQQIKKAANDFVIDNIELFDNTNTVTIKLGVLKQKGYLPINIKNPKTKQNISNESTITIKKINNKFEIILNLIDMIDVTENIDLNSPIIILNGDYVEYVDVNSTYQEKGATAKSSTGETLNNISIQIKLDNVEKSSIDTSKLLTYNIIYSVTDSRGLTTSATRTVIIRDNEAPTISFPKETTLLANQVNGYDLRQSVIVSDNYDSNTTITINSGLSNRQGKYVVTYTAKDSSGNETTERRIIIVENTPTYIIKGKTIPSSSDTPTMENPVTYYGLGRDNYIDVIETRGKNIFDEESILMAIYGATYTDGHYVFGVGQAYAKYKNSIPTIKFKENTQYTFTIKGYSIGNDPNTNNGFTNFRIVFKYTDGTETYRVLNSLTETELTYTSTAGKTVEKIYMYYGYVGNAYISHIQLEEGNTATPYEPYNGSTTRINLTGHDPLMCADNVCDYIDYENSRIVRYIKKYTFTGNESFGGLNSPSWIANNTETTKGLYYRNDSILGTYPDNIKVKNHAGFCTHFPLVVNSAFNKNDTLRYCPFGNSNPPYLSFRIPIDTDMNTWTREQYNAGTPLIAYYVLNNPEYESINLPQVNLYWNSNTFVTDGYITKTYN